jgi:hypothetical protein
MLWKNGKARFLTFGITGILDFVHLSFLEYRTMDKVQNPSNSECYTPSPDPFRIYKIFNFSKK